MKFQKITQALGLFGLIIYLAAPASANLSDDVVGTLYTMKTVYSAEYAPAAWKKQYANYDLATEFDKAVAAAKANPTMTIAESRKIFKEFVYAMKDYHTSMTFVSTEAASLPFIIHGVGDRYFILYINRAKLSEAAFPFSVGDELVSVDGGPTGDKVAEVQNSFTANVPETDKAEAELRFTNRTAARGVDTIPSGPVTLGIKRQGETAVSSIQLIWDYTPEAIAPRSAFDASKNFDLSNKVPAGIFHPVMSVQTDAPSAGVVETPFDLGVRKTFTPDLGTKIWESAPDSPYYAYMYKRDDRKIIGYVRIPQYEVDDYPKALEEFAKIIQLFQTATDSMVIDQVNNPGGSVFYLYGLASMLTDQPLKTPLHRMAITQADVAAAITAIATLKDVKTDDDAKKAFKPDELDGYPASYEFAKFTLNYAHFIISEWTDGRKLTNPYWIAGVDHINPAPVHYTKPILLVINHLDFSGGDFFPTIMQDNHRVTVFGSRTAGAGGYVNDINVPNNVGINTFRCTESIAERVTGNPIENLGVTPDVPYEMSVEDYTQGFAPYVKAIQTAVSAITP